MTCEFFESLKPRLPMKASMVPVGGWIEELRMIKSPEELALIRRSVETNSRAFEQTVARVKPGMREQDLATELEDQPLEGRHESAVRVRRAEIRPTRPHAGK